jgi:hypothetical protein
LALWTCQVGQVFVWLYTMQGLPWRYFLSRKRGQSRTFAWSARPSILPRCSQLPNGENASFMINICLHNNRYEMHVYVSNVPLFAHSIWK